MLEFLFGLLCFFVSRENVVKLCLVACVCGAAVADESEQLGTAHLFQFLIFVALLRRCLCLFSLFLALPLSFPLLLSLLLPLPLPLLLLLLVFVFKRRERAE